MENNQYTVVPQPEMMNPYRVTLCNDGVYRWIHEYNMFRNPTILFTVYKVIFMSAAMVAIFALLLRVLSGDFEWPPFKDFDWESSKYGIIVMAGFLFLLPPLAYLIVARLYGGKYMVLFEMDDKTITFHQMEKTFRKSQAISWVTGFIGALSGNLSLTGLSIVNSTRQTMTSEYSKVRRVIPQKRRGVIKVNHRFLHNQIYVSQEDFDFVLQYIKEHTGLISASLMD